MKRLGIFPVTIWSFCGFSACPALCRESLTPRSAMFISFVSHSFSTRKEERTCEFGGWQTRRPQEGRFTCRTSGEKTPGAGQTLPPPTRSQGNDAGEDPGPSHKRTGGTTGDTPKPASPPPLRPGTPRPAARQFPRPAASGPGGRPAVCPRHGGGARPSGSQSGGVLPLAGDGTGRAPCCLRGGRGGQPAVSQRRHLQPGGSPSLRAVLQGARPRVQPRSAADMKQSKPNKEGRGGRRPPKQPPNPRMFNAGRPDPTDRRSPLRPSRGRPLPVRPPEAAEEEEEEMEGWRDGAGESGPSLPACRSLARQTRLPSAVE